MSSLLPKSVTMHIHINDVLFAHSMFSAVHTFCPMHVILQYNFGSNTCVLKLPNRFHNELWV